MTLRDRIRGLLPQGFAIKDLPNPRNTLHRNVQALVDAGEAFKGGEHAGVKWFDTREKAAAYVPPKPAPIVRSIPMQHRAAIPKDAPPFVVKAKTRAGWEPDAPMVVTATTKFTVGPSFRDPPHTTTHNVW